jgi:hypothetical protein
MENDTTEAKSFDLALASQGLFYFEYMDES